MDATVLCGLHDLFQLAWIGPNALDNNERNIPEKGLCWIQF